VAATNRRPSEAVAKETLREDLLYRLSVFPIALPPLRERGDDVVLLARHFVDELNRQTGTSKSLNAEGTARLRRYHWPGNVRQLRNLIKRVHIMADEAIDMLELDALISGEDAIMSAPSAPFKTPAESSSSPGEASSVSTESEIPGIVDVPLGTTIAEAEQKLILATLEQCNGDKKKAAEQLGVSVKTIYNRLKEYEVDAV